MFDSGGIGSSDAETTITDQSTAYGATDQGSGDQQGAKLLLGNASGATINVSDPLAVQLAKEIGLSAINNSGMTASAVTSLARQAMADSAGLKRLTLEGEGDKIISIAKWLGLGVIGYLLLKPKKRARA